MSSEVTVFVVCDTSAQPINTAAIVESIRRKTPSAQMNYSSGNDFHAGLYSTTPIVVSFNDYSTVLEESQEMADDAARAGASADIVAQVRLGNARFEVHWDLRSDDDPVPETGDLIFDIAQAIAGHTGGTILISGSRLYNPEEWGYPQLFPE